ncbi:D-aminoacyl-tRNA deacylase [Salirhabdus salicampi]|uniref:D-aminoacyl-tRNA deacylase n=1 Tax=Salirhabdus salicampi TaxID=476102 RepID=UPI0020C5A707|nr:D-aminoacyl-tRNA deacylase [Salirhabdus salicampi]MCP8616976.1 D-aminoacyl-tRNA deacylase [Salirhabdus salicampi]
MRAVIQRASKAHVTVDGEVTGEINQGIVILLGVTHEDEEKDAKWLADKIVHLRIFEDESGKMNHSLKDVGGQALSVSQFTLYGDCRKGRRPNFMEAAKPEPANILYETFNRFIEDHGIQVKTGVFGAMMDVSLVNDGPVTLLLDTKDI